MFTKQCYYFSVREKWERGGWRSAAHNSASSKNYTPFSKSKSIHHLLGEILFSLTNDWLLLRRTLTRTGKLSTFLLLRSTFSIFPIFSRFECPLQLPYVSQVGNVHYNFVCLSRPLKFWTADKHSRNSRSINKILDGKKRKNLYFSLHSAATFAGHNSKVLVPRPRRAITLVKFVINFSPSSFSISQRERCLQIIQRI